MDTDRKGWWRRLFRGLRRTRSSTEATLPPAGEDGLLVEPAGEEPRGENTGKETTGLARWTKRDTAVARLQEGYEKVNQLIADMQKHMAEQSARTERMCSAIERLAQAMMEIPQASAIQAGTLQSILGQLQSAQSQSERMTSVLDGLSKAVKSQETALNDIGRGVEMMAEQSVVGSQATEKLVGAIQRLGDEDTRQTQLLQEMIEHLGEQSREVRHAMERSDRRFTALWIATLIVAAVGLGAALFGLLRG